MFTPVQIKMLTVLADGLPHSVDELQRCLNDDLGEAVNVRMHLVRLRRKLASVHQMVVCEAMPGGRSMYRHVLLLSALRMLPSVPLDTVSAV